MDSPQPDRAGARTGDGDRARKRGHGPGCSRHRGVAKPSVWFDGQASIRRDITRFDLLVPVNGQEIGWNALEQALADRRALACTAARPACGCQRKPGSSPESEAVKTIFEERCRAAGVDGKLVMAVGEVVKEVKRRARWTDLMVVNLAHPPGSGVLDKLRPGFRSLVRQTAWPMLVTPSHTSPLTRPLLAFDGSRNSVQALVSADLPRRPLAVADHRGDGDTRGCASIATPSACPRTISTRVASTAIR